MDTDCFSVIESRADRHWFFQGRKALVHDQLKRASAYGRLLDVGCGTGYLAASLALSGYDVVGVEPDVAARAFARKRLPEVVEAGAYPLPFSDASFDVVIATDVLEHVPDDQAAVREMFRVLRPGGLAVVTVPAMRILWGPQDVRLGHYRRYGKKQLADLFISFDVRRLSYFNMFLFPVMIVARTMFRLFPASYGARDEVAMTPAFLNTPLRWFLELETALIRFCSLPYGGSLILVARKPQA